MGRLGEALAPYVAQYAQGMHLTQAHTGRSADKSKMYVEKFARSVHWPIGWQIEWHAVATQTVSVCFY